MRVRWKVGELKFEESIYRLEKVIKGKNWEMSSRMCGAVQIHLRLVISSL